MATETVLVFLTAPELGKEQKYREWVAPHNNVRMYLMNNWVIVEGEAYESTLVAFNNVVEAHLVTREKAEAQE